MGGVGVFEQQRMELEKRERGGDDRGATGRIKKELEVQVGVT